MGRSAICVRVEFVRSARRGDDAATQIESTSSESSHKSQMRDGKSLQESHAEAIVTPLTPVIRFDMIKASGVKSGQSGLMHEKPLASSSEIKVITISKQFEEGH